MKNALKFTRRHILAGSAALGMCPLMEAQNPAGPPKPKPRIDPGPPFVPSDPPNTPMGVG